MGRHSMPAQPAVQGSQLKLFRKIFTAITKPRFVVALIILILIAAFAGVMIPQAGDKGPSYFEAWRLTSPKTLYLVRLLQLDRVYTSVWFLTLVFVVMLSLGHSLYSQVKRNLGRKNSAPSRDLAGWDVLATASVIEEDGLIRFMKQRGYSLKNKGDALFAFSKNFMNRWGGVIFHSGLFLIIVAAIIGLAFQKRGFVQVMEGEVFSGNHDAFLVQELGVFPKSFDVGFKTRLSKFKHEYWETGQIKDVSSSVAVIGEDGTARERTITVNSPVKYKGINIYQSLDYGYALSFILKRPGGKETVTHFLLDHSDKRARPLIGSSDFPQTPYIFKMEFYPDISMNSFHLGKPILYLKVLNGNDMVFHGLIIPGNVIKIEGNLVKFFNISPWSGLIYVKNPGMALVYAGFLISCMGAALIFFLPHKEIFISLNGHAVTVYGRTNRYRPLFEEELEGIKRDILTYGISNNL